MLRANECDPPFRASERIAITFVAVLLLVLRVVWAFRYEIDSDEPQHLHVAWAWTRGLVQYRDVFDNHAPLFHLLTAPLVAFFGERVDIISMMRLAMLPLFFGTLFLIYDIGRILFDRRAGALAALLLGFFDCFFFRSLEYRTDDLWVFLCMLAMRVFAGGELTRRRGWIGGLTIGAAFAVSLKTLLLVLALALGAIVVGLPRCVAIARSRDRAALRSGLLLFGTILLGALCIPILLAGFIKYEHAWRAAEYCLVTHNTGGAGAGLRAALAANQVFLLRALLVGVLGYVALPRDERRVRATFIVVTSAMLVGLFATWPILQGQTLLLCEPPAMLCVGAGALALVRHASKFLGHAARAWLASPFATAAIVGLICVVGARRLEAYSPITTDNTRPADEIIRDVLRLTKPDEYVFDAKGASVFRSRAWYYVLETFTKRRLAKNLIKNDIADQIARNGACVAVFDQELPGVVQRMIEAYFVDLGTVRVVGSVLRTRSEPAKTRCEFDLLVSADYAIVGDGFVPKGLLDGTPYAGPRSLMAGKHVYEPAPGEATLVAVWSRAIERGFSPLPFVEERR